MKKVSLIWLCLTAITWANTATFSPHLGFLWDSNTSFRAHQEIGYVFQNPAGLAEASEHQLKVENAQDFFGYQQLNLSYLFPTSWGNWGVGYYTLYASDIVRTSKSEGARPTETGTFGQTFQNYVIAYSKKWNPTWQFGVQLKGQLQTLDTQTAQSFGADVGVIWTPTSFFWASGYTQNLFNTGYSWSTGAQDPFSTSFVTAVGVRGALGQAEISTDWTYYKAKGEWALTPQFRLIGGYLLNPQTSYGRYSYGTALDLGPCSLQYLHLSSQDELLSNSQDIIGLTYFFGNALQMETIRWRLPRL